MRSNFDSTVLLLCQEFFGMQICSRCLNMFYARFYVLGIFAPKTL